MKNVIVPVLKFIVHIVSGFKPRWDAVVGKYQLDKIKNRGEGCYIYGDGTFIDPAGIVLGDGVQIGRNFYFAGSGGIEIGSFCHISRNVTIYSRNHDYQSSALPYDQSFIYKAVKIGKCVWIGMNVNIAPGVTIGDGAIIGIGTTISKDVPAGAIVVGSSSRVVGHRDATHYAELYKRGRFWGKNMAVQKKMPDKPYSEHN